MRILIAVCAIVLAGCGGDGTSHERSGSNLIESATWSHSAAGYRLHVRPTRSGRLTSAARGAAALREALADGGPSPIELTPDQRASLEDQLRCHAAFAPYKPAWNLETWRPNVGYPRMVLDRCNP